jgi:hypothetical protein
MMLSLPHFLGWPQFCCCPEAKIASMSAKHPLLLFLMLVWPIWYHGNWGTNQYKKIVPLEPKGKILMSVFTYKLLYYIGDIRLHVNNKMVLSLMEEILLPYKYWIFGISPNAFLGSCPYDFQTKNIFCIFTFIFFFHFFPNEGEICPTAKKNMCSQLLALLSPMIVKNTP